jgi:hypothetical protein
MLGGKLGSSRLCRPLGDDGTMTEEEMVTKSVRVSERNLIENIVRYSGVVWVSL